MKKLLVFIFVATSLISTPPASAGKSNEPCQGEGACQGKQGDCREVEKGGYCEDNDFSPTFDKSPVERSFNPVFCLPGATCNFDGQEDQKPKE